MYYIELHDWKEFKHCLHRNDLDILLLLEKDMKHQAIANRLGLAQGGVTSRITKLIRRLPYFRKMPHIALGKELDFLTPKNREMMVKWGWNYVSMNELSRQYHVSTVTVRRMILGTIEKLRKAKTKDLVKYFTLRQRYSNFLQSFSMRFDQCQPTEIIINTQTTANRLIGGMSPKKSLSVN